MRSTQLFRFWRHLWNVMGCALPVCIQHSFWMRPWLSKSVQHWKQDEGFYWKAECYAKRFQSRADLFTRMICNHSRNFFSSTCSGCTGRGASHANMRIPVFNLGNEYIKSLTFVLSIQIFLEAVLNNSGAGNAYQGVWPFLELCPVASFKHAVSLEYWRSLHNAAYSSRTPGEVPGLSTRSKVWFSPDRYWNLVFSDLCHP
jgi:hypothetical protein